MSLYDYRASQDVALTRVPFYALIMAAMRQADSDNVVKLRAEFPETWDELQLRYHAPGGLLDGEVAVWQKEVTS